MKLTEQVTQGIRNEGRDPKEKSIVLAAYANIYVYVLVCMYVICIYYVYKQCSLVFRVCLAKYV